MRALLASALLLVALPVLADQRPAVACGESLRPRSRSSERAPDAAARGQMIANEVKAGTCRTYRNTACLVPGNSRQGFSCMSETKGGACRWIHVDAALDHVGNGNACS